MLSRRIDSAIIWLDGPKRLWMGNDVGSCGTRSIWPSVISTVVIRGQRRASFVILSISCPLRETKRQRRKELDGNEDAKIILRARAFTFTQLNFDSGNELYRALHTVLTKSIASLKWIIRQQFHFRHHVCTRRTCKQLGNVFIAQHTCRLNTLQRN